MSIKILLVDDSAMVRSAMGLCIEQNSKFEVCGEAENGQAAVDLFRQLRPDVVIMDFAMPIKNGLDAAAEMTQIAPNVPILMCTIFKSDQLVRDARKAGVKKVISKGEKLSSTLLPTIQNLLAS